MSGVSCQLSAGADHLHHSLKPARRGCPETITRAVAPDYRSPERGWFNFHRAAVVDKDIERVLRSSPLKSLESGWSHTFRLPSPTQDRRRCTTAVREVNAITEITASSRSF